MNNSLIFDAVSAWAAFGANDYTGLENHGASIYNYFVHHPAELLNLDYPLLIGKVFQVCLGFREPDIDIQEVRAENAFVCFMQALKKGNQSVQDEASARIMMLLIFDQKFLLDRVDKVFSHDSSIMGILSGSSLPQSMPIATNTKMLYAACYLYNNIKDKEGLSHEFVNKLEWDIFTRVTTHMHESVQTMKSSHQERVELGRIVIDKIYDALRDDIKGYAQM